MKLFVQLCCSVQDSNVRETAVLNIFINLNSVIVMTSFQAHCGNTHFNGNIKNGRR